LINDSKTLVVDYRDKIFLTFDIWKKKKKKFTLTSKINLDGKNNQLIKKKKSEKYFNEKS